MTTIRESILANLTTQLAGTVGVGTRIYRSRVTPVSREEGTVLIVEPISDSCQTNRNKFQWTLNIRISVITRGSATQTADQVADPTVKSVHDKIVSDITIGGKAIDITPRNVSFDLIDGDQPSGVVSLDYIIIYQTLTTDLST
tara:strand:- start:990 stop:1418 length:429 start_codon:yes stop_codon:yes gene_type:complete